MPAPRRHYAWTVLGLCFLAILCAQGVRLSFGAFVRPWEDAFDASRGTITLIGSLSFLVYGGSQPFVGRAVDRFGIRRTLAASTVLVAAGMALSAAAPGPLALALSYGVLASLGFGGASGVAASVAVTYWFTSRRGLAFALVEAGFGRRPARARAALPRRGLGARVARGAGRRRDAARARRSAGAAGFVDTHLIPLAQDRGIADATAGLAVALLAAANVTGILASGPLADRVDNRRLLSAMYLTRGAGSSCSCSSPTRARCSRSRCCSGSSTSPSSRRPNGLPPAT